MIYLLDNVQESASVTNCEQLCFDAIRNLPITSLLSLDSKHPSAKDFSWKNDVLIARDSGYHHNNKVVNYRERALGILIKEFKKGDVLVCYSPKHLIPSLHQYLDLLKELSNKEITIAFVEPAITFRFNGVSGTTEFLNHIQKVERYFLSIRTMKSLKKAKERGVQLGRPRGMLNKRTKLDARYHEIKLYADLGINKSNIAKLIGCHAQTISNFLKRKDIQIKSKKAA